MIIISKKLFSHRFEILLKRELTDLCILDIALFRNFVQQKWYRKTGLPGVML
nr:MAG TPA: hypothetical protein [Caudoviricetes sp.]